MNLSDEELARLNPEELEEVRKAKENLREIKKADREVKVMMDQEQLEQRIEEYMQAKGLSREQAELLARQDFGLVGPSQLRPLFMQPPEDPITKALKDAIAERIHLLFPQPGAGAGGGGATGGGPQTGAGQPADLSGAIKAAKEHGVKSLYLPDGTLLEINPSDTLGDELVKKTMDWLKDQVPSLFTGGGGGKTSTELLSSGDPEIVKLGLEYRAKEEERKAAETLAQARTAMAQDVAAAIGLLLSPEGFKKAREAIRGIIEAAREGRGTRTVLIACDECKTVNEVPEGKEVFSCNKCGAENEVSWE